MMPFDPDVEVGRLASDLIDLYVLFQARCEMLLAGEGLQKLPVTIILPCQSWSSLYVRSSSSDDDDDLVGVSELALYVFRSNELCLTGA